VVGVVDDGDAAGASHGAEGEVGAEVADDLDGELVLVGGSGRGEEVRVDGGGHLEAPGAGSAGVEGVEGCGLAEEGLGEAAGEGVLADAGGADEEEGVRHAAGGEGVPQLVDESVMTA
jgi:hypothetical protein